MDKAAALAVVWAVTAVNCLGLHTGAKVANGFLVLKLFAVFSIAVAGIVVGIRTGSHWSWFNAEWIEPAQQREGSSAEKSMRHGGGVGTTDIWALLGEYVTALLAALWVYGGWDSVSSYFLHLLCRTLCPALTDDIYVWRSV
jgi:amino acid transporter